jgi:cathepsin D
MGGFTIAGQTLLAVSTLSSSLIDGSVSGIMGLGWAPLANTRANPFWYNLASNNGLTSQDMSFFLTREQDNPKAAAETFGGVFTLGGVNDTLYTGDIEFLTMPVQTPSFWLLGLSSTTVNGASISVATGTSALSAIDTGTTLIGGPTDDVAKVWAAVPGSALSTSSAGFYTFPCTTKVTVTMAFGGKSWTINPDDMNLGPLSSSSSQCMGAIFDLSMGSDIPPGGDNPSWVVGDTFLKNVYTVLRASPPSVGFAQLSAAAGGGSAPSGGTSGGSGTSSSDSYLKSASLLGLTISLVLGLFSAI